jgi:mersacidin/lichenicidin family type 2 lantibiotic
MKKQDIIRAWRDPKFRRGLSAEQQAQLPSHPAGAIIGVEDDVLTGVTGGCCLPELQTTKAIYCSAFCTPCPPRQCY